MNTVPSASKNRYMYPITFNEFQAFIGLMMLTGIFRVHRKPISNLYCDDSNLSRPIFKATLPRERFKLFLRFFRFDDFRTTLERIKTDRLASNREVFKKVTCALRESYNPNKLLTIDEHLCLNRGRCSFLQYIPSKPDRYGMKMFVIADSLTFYPINIDVYTVKNQLSNKPVDVDFDLLHI